MCKKEQLNARFNPRPRTGGDRKGARYRARVECFNPRPRTGGDAINTTGPGDRTCFNPRPRTGGDAAERYLGIDGKVSIHAPARGATVE